MSVDSAEWVWTVGCAVALDTYETCSVFVVPHTMQHIQLGFDISMFESKRYVQ